MAVAEDLENVDESPEKEQSQSGKLVRNEKGQFVEGKSGNPLGRPKGSKNKITIAKLMVEEAFREGHANKILHVLELVLNQALEGDKTSQKLVWDSAMSKQAVAEDKTAANKQQITVHTMNVTKDQINEGEIIDEEETQ